MKNTNSIAHIFNTFFSVWLIHCVLFVNLAIAQDDNGRGVGVRKDNSASTVKRLALVIGNGDYQNTSKLDNPVNDATDMTSTLESLGFEVISGTDQTKRQMEDMIKDFGNRLADSKGVGLFFYAGHGIAKGGVNYLIPVDAKIDAEDEIQYYSVSMNFLLNKLNSAQNGFNMVILDACRNNPFARSWRNFRDIGDKGGLARVNAPTGTLIAYATKPGDVASDGDGRNGLYTGALLKQMKVKNVDVTKMLQNVRRDVLEKSGNKQVPFDESSLVGDFYFAGKGGGTTTTTVARNPEDELWNEVSRTKTERAYESYIKTYPNGKYVPVARLKLRNLKEETKWNFISDSTNRNDFEDFVSSYPDGIYTDQAKTRFDQVWWESIKQSPDSGEVNTYLNKFPDGNYVADARRKLKELGNAVWQTIKDSEDKEKIQTFIDNHPTSSYISQAQTELKRLEAIIKAGTVSKLKLSDEIEMSFSYIPAGEFEMGSHNGDKDERPVHRVIITRGFWMGQTEVTQEQWQKVMGSNPSEFLNCPKCPVDNVTRNESLQFMNRLNNLSDGYQYRLPTEAEWEYAARAGNTGDFSGVLNSIAWYESNSGKKTNPVGQKTANAWGLFDIHGNVWEWVKDDMASKFEVKKDPSKNYYSGSPLEDPQGPNGGKYGTARGGAYDSPEKDLRFANRRNGIKPSWGKKSIGLRLVRVN